MAVIRKIGELVGYAVLGALIAPLLSSFISGMVIDQVSNFYTIPMVTIAGFLLSFLISFGLKLFMISHMTLDLNHVSVAVILFMMQFMLCSIFILLGVNLFIMLGVMAGSFFNIITTIIMRPFTAVRQIKELGEEHLGKYWKK